MILFARTRSTAIGWLALVVAFAIAAVAARLTYTLPHVGWDKPVPLAPFVSSLPAMCLGFLLLNRMSTLERQRQPRLMLARAGWAMLCVGGLTLATAIVAVARMVPQWQLVAVRNAAALVGLALLSAVAVGGRLAWVIVLSVTLAELLAGRDINTGEPAAWALLTAPADAALSTVASVLLVAAGVALYAWRDSRPTSGLADER